MIEDEILTNSVMSFSKKGIINSLFSDLASKRDSAKLIDELLSLIEFSAPIHEWYDGKLFRSVTAYEVLLEPCLSDFGCPDIVLLLDSYEDEEDFLHRSIVFIEARVNGVGRNGWSGKSEFNRFVSGVNRGIIGPSNLFGQLYLKTVLADKLSNSGSKSLEVGVDIGGFVRQSRKLDKTDDLVLYTVERIFPYCYNSYLVSLVPNASDYFDLVRRISLRLHMPENWRRRWGVLEWGSVAGFCDSNGFSTACLNFDINKVRIFGFPCR